MKYQAKNVKQMMTHRGYAYTASIYEDGKCIAKIQNMGDGRDTRYEWKSIAAEKELKSKYDNLSLDVFMEDLVNDFLEGRELKRKYKGKTLIQTESCKDGEWIIFNIGYTLNVAAKLREKYGNKMVIANEKYDFA